MDTDNQGYTVIISLTSWVLPAFSLFETSVFVRVHPWFIFVSRVKYSPVFRRPWKLGVVLSYIFGWPGYIWPSNLLFFGVTALIRFWFHPALERCAEFRFDWIAQMFARNMALI